jgi:hypothetical protein
METTRPAGSRVIGLVEGIVGRARAAAACLATEGNAFADDLGFDTSNAQAIFKIAAPVLA